MADLGEEEVQRATGLRGATGGWKPSDSRISLTCARGMPAWVIVAVFGTGAATGCGRQGCETGASGIGGPICRLPGAGTSQGGQFGSRGRFIPHGGQFGVVSAGGGVWLLGGGIC